MGTDRRNAIQLELAALAERSRREGDLSDAEERRRATLIEERDAIDRAEVEAARVRRATYVDAARVAWQQEMYQRRLLGTKQDIVIGGVCMFFGVLAFIMVFANIVMAPAVIVGTVSLIFGTLLLVFGFIDMWRVERQPEDDGQATFSSARATKPNDEASHRAWLDHMRDEKFKRGKAELSIGLVLLLAGTAVMLLAYGTAFAAASYVFGPVATLIGAVQCGHGGLEMRGSRTWVGERESAGD